MKQGNPSFTVHEANLQLAGGGDAESLCIRCMPLVQGLAGRMIRRGLPVQKEDLVQAGCIGLLCAAKHYDSCAETQFQTYAVPWILGEMRKALRHHLDYDKGYAARKRLLNAQKTLAGELGRAPQLDELCSETGVSRCTAAALLNRLSGPLSLDDLRVDVFASSGADSLPNHDYMDLHEALIRLPPQERCVVTHRFIEDRTQLDTAHLMGRSQSYVSKTEQRALLRLRAMLSDDQQSIQAQTAQSIPRKRAKTER